MDHDDYEMPVADAKWLKKVLKVIKQFTDDGKSIQTGRELFFMYALQGYYDCMWSGMDKNVGHLVYRISDFIDEETRKQMMIYPSDEGTIVNNGLELWDSLEDWRKQWEATHKVIPEFDFQRHLAAIRILRLPETTSRI